MELDRSSQKYSKAATAWFPICLTPQDNSLAPPLHTSCESTKQLTVPFQFVSWRWRSSKQQFIPHGIAYHFAGQWPGSEVSGSVPLWWDNFLAAEARRIAGTCVSCVCIRRELTTIVIHQTKHRGGADGAAKVVNAAKQQELQVEPGSRQ